MVFSFCTKAAAGLVLWWLFGKQNRLCEGGRGALVGYLLTHRARCFRNTERGWTGSPKIHRMP